MQKAYKQKLFNRVARHLLKQNRASTSCGVCRYRGPDGTTCAIGCLIPDSRYSSEFEGKNISALQLYNMLDKVFTPAQLTELSMLTALQEVHDYNLPNAWKAKLFDVAKHYGLNTNAIDNI